MARDISIAYSARDQISPAVNSMRSSNRQFNKDLEETQQKIDTLNKRQDSLTEGLAKAKRRQDEMTAAYKEAKKAYAEYGEVLGKDYLDEYARHMTEAIQQTRDFENTIRSNRREIQRQSDDLNRMANRASGSEQSIMGSLAQAGMFNMVGTSAVNALNAGIGSMFGDAVGDAINTTLSGAIDGATFGLAMGGIPGALVGAGIGTITGVIDAATQSFQRIDDAFTSTIESGYTQYQEQQNANLQSGSSIAAGRETALISFSTLFGDREVAEQYLNEMRDMSNTTPFLYDDLAQMSKTLLTYGFDQDQLLPQLTAVGDTGAALGMSTQDMNMVSTGLGRMYSSDKATLEYLNPLLERGIPVIDYLAEDSGKTNKEIYEAISKGEISGKDAVSVTTHYLEQSFSGSMEQQSKSFEGLTSTLLGLNQELQNSMGEGYNEARLPGMQEERDWLEGETANTLAESNRHIGAFHASLESLAEKYKREAYDAVLSGADTTLYDAEQSKTISEMRSEWQRAYSEGNGEDQEAIRGRLDAFIENTYQNDAALAEYRESQKTMLERMQEDLAMQTDYLREQVDLQNQISKGMAAGLLDGLSGGGIGQIVSKGSSVISAAASGRLMGGDDTFAPSAALQLWDRRYGANDSPAPGNAWGLPYVPYDNYLTRLHQGERVLTASEVRAADHGPPTITINMPDAVIREEADIDKIARAIAANIIQAQRITTTGG